MPATMIGAQASSEQLEKMLSYIEIGKQEGAKVLAGGGQAHLGGELEGGYYVTPTVFEGHNQMRIFQEEIFGPGAVGDHVPQRRGSAGDRQRHANTAWAPASGRATATAPTGSAAPSRPAASGPTATTSIRRMRRSAATSSPASAARPTR